MSEAFPRYPMVNPTSMAILRDLILRRRRKFGADAAALARRLEPNLIVEGTIPTVGPSGCVIEVNHYTRPGFPSWWIALSVSAVFPREIHWVITKGWVYADLLRSLTITPASLWILRRITATYDFTAMPPMPPQPEESQARAVAVRALLRYVDSRPAPIIGLAPEGADSPDGILSPPPPGAGRLLHSLLTRGLTLIPVGVYEEDEHLRVHFGEVIKPKISYLHKAELDQILSNMTMQAIAACLPPRLRGAYT